MGRRDGLFQCFACLECMRFGEEGNRGGDASFVEERDVFERGMSLKRLAARAAIKHGEKLLGKDFRSELPGETAEYLDKFDVAAGPNEKGGSEEEPPAAKRAKEEEEEEEEEEEKKSALVLAEHLVRGWTSLAKKKGQKLASGRKKRGKKSSSRGRAQEEEEEEESSEIPGPYEINDHEEEILQKMDVNSEFLEAYKCMCCYTQNLFFFFKKNNILFSDPPGPFFGSGEYLCEKVKLGEQKTKS